MGKILAMLMSVVFFSVSAFALDHVAPTNLDNYEAPTNLDEQLAKANEMQQFSEAYGEHVKERDKRRGVRGQFSGNFKFFHTTCMGNGVSIGGGMSHCDCPQKTRNMACLISATTTVKFNESDVGGKGYVLITASDGKHIYALINGEWLHINKLKKGSASYIVEKITSAPMTFNIPFKKIAQEQSCGSRATMSAITYKMNTGYGSADKWDMDYVRLLKKNQINIDEEELLWQSARIDGFKTKNSKEIGILTCGSGY